MRDSGRLGQGVMFGAGDLPVLVGNQDQVLFGAGTMAR
jgi:hypothetical protein